MNGQESYLKEYGIIPTILVVIVCIFIGMISWTRIFNVYHAGHLDTWYMFRLMIIDVIFLLVQWFILSYLKKSSDKTYRPIALPIVLFLASYMIATVFGFFLFLGVLNF